MGRLPLLKQDIPWIAIEDFNTVLYPHEKIGGNPISAVECNKFDDCLKQYGLLDMNQNGLKLSWSNKQEGRHRICCKLDKALSNEHWYSFFPESQSWVFPPGFSDHSPMVISLLNYA